MYIRELIIKAVSSKCDLIKPGQNDVENGFNAKKIYARLVSAVNIDIDILRALRSLCLSHLEPKAFAISQSRCYHASRRGRLDEIPQQQTQIQRPPTPPLGESHFPFPFPYHPIYNSSLTPLPPSTAKSVYVNPSATGRALERNLQGAQEKQTRDENGFKCHTQSESHVRQMLLIGEDPRKHISSFSHDFQVGLLGGPSTLFLNVPRVTTSENMLP